MPSFETNDIPRDHADWEREKGPARLAQPNLTRSVKTAPDRRGAYSRRRRRRLARLSAAIRERKRRRLCFHRPSAG